MTKTNGIIKFCCIALLILSTAIFSSCRNSKKTQKNNRIHSQTTVTNKSSRNQSNPVNNNYVAGDKKFYETFSKKFGVNFKGNENKWMIEEIDAWLGTPYKYGGNSQKGTDCSGFIMTVYKKVNNIDLNRSAYDQMQNTHLINKNEMRFGDLVFFKIDFKKVSHVGLYLGDNKFVHASTKRGVVINDMNETYYKERFFKGGRIIK